MIQAVTLTEPDEKVCTEIFSFTSLWSLDPDLGRSLFVRVQESSEK